VSNKKNSFERTAKLLEGGKIEINADAKTVVVRKVKDEDFITWPDLEKPKAKRGRKKKVKVDGDNQGTAESDAE
jgi:hypothetical protein